MPTNAFYKLDDEKKNQLLESAIKEFSELPYDKVSIFQIARSAGISRSGFYYYFKDKKDVYLYLVNSIKEEFLTKYPIVDNKIDFFELGENIFAFLLEIKGTKREALFRRLITNIKPEDLIDFVRDVQEADCCNKNADIYISGGRQLTEYQKKGAGMFLGQSLILASCLFFDGGYSNEEAKDKLHEMFEIIKIGIIKGE